MMQVDLSGLDSPSIASPMRTTGLAAMPSVYQRPSSRKINVTKLELFDSGVFQPMFMRPYESPSLSRLDHGRISDVIQSRLDSIGNTGNTISPSLLTGVSGSLLGFSAAPVSNILIPNGWDTKRFTFIMHVQSESTFGSAEYYILQGYTDYDGISHGNHIDDDMRFHINSFIQLTQSVNPMTRQIDNRITDCKQLLDARVLSQSIAGSTMMRDSMHAPDPHTMRPMDIFSGIQSSYLANYSASSIGEMELIDQRNRLNARDMYSSRANNVPSQHLATVLTSWRQHTNDLSSSLDDSDSISLMIQNTAISAHADNDFITKLANIQGIRGGMTSCFTLRDLKSITNSVAPSYLKSTGRALAALPTTMSVGTWNGSTATNMVASSLLSIVPTLMIQCGLQSATVTGTNMTQGMASYDVRCSDSRSLTTGNTMAMGQLLLDRIRNEVMPDITMNNGRYVTFVMYLDMFKATTIDIQVGSDPKERKTAPAYCDALFSPVVAPTNQHFDAVISDMQHMFNTVDTSTPASSKGLSTQSLNGLIFPNNF